MAGKYKHLRNWGFPTLEIWDLRRTDLPEVRCEGLCMRVLSHGIGGYGPAGGVAAQMVGQQACRREIANPFNRDQQRLIAFQIGMAVDMLSDILLQLGDLLGDKVQVGLQRSGLKIAPEKLKRFIAGEGMGTGVYLCPEPLLIPGSLVDSLHTRISLQQILDGKTIIIDAHL